ncbi:DUF4974 domain-containing protein [Olivibacter ginsenosidimutans]|uniref:DUF4974 domain-containing protein n=1 Tax=Olivibacter ginsenosidimutans TaxID=1176537 RepID=A0ABP9BGD8_9SPHI
MDRANTRILQLLEKVHQNTATEAELEELNTWYERFDKEEIAVKPWNEQEEEEMGAALKQRIWASLGKDKYKRKRKIGVLGRKDVSRLIPYAAAASMVLVLGCLFFFSKHDKQQNKENDQRLLLGTVVGNKAVLSFDDGKRFILDSAAGTIKVNDGQVLYTNGKPVSNKQSEDQFMEIRTPKGGRYTVILSDGTKVWLNAATKLRYAAQFKPNEKRVVELDGEAFFEVSQQKNKPFMVRTQHQEVEVLGTAFNVNAYADEPAVKTSLLNGKVRVKADNMVQELHPDEEVVWQAGKLSKRKADMQQVLAWKSGRFAFDNKNLQQVMREMSRWYDLEVVYEGKIEELTFFGGTHANADIATVLNMLEANGLAYRLEGNRRLVIAKALK